VSRLRTKLYRDLWSARWQFLAISIVASLGVALFHGSLVGYENQKESYRVTYERTRFADLWLPVDGAPRSVVRQIRRLPYVREAEGRLVVDLEVEQDPGRRKKVTGRMVSVPTRGGPALNQVRLVRGRMLSHPPRREVLLEAGFAKEHNYRPGDRIYPVIEERRLAFTVVGIVTSPEYVYAVASKQFLIPTPETFGVLFVPQQEMEALLGLAGTINEIAVLTEPGRERQVAEAAMRRLRAYGPEKPIPRAEQPSNQLLQSDLEGNKPFLVVMPSLFLGAAALAVFLLLARWVQAQRGQVGFLRASGFSGRDVLLHYLEAGLAIGVGGGLLGVFLGHLLGLWISSIYAQFYNTPYPYYSPQPQVGVLAFSLSVVACVLGALGPAWNAGSIPPAEAMRGQIPASPRLAGAIRLPTLLAMPLRNVMRRPLRSLTTAASLATAVTMVVLAGTMQDSLAEVERVYLRDIQRYDLTVSFNPPRSETALSLLRQLPGVLRVEGSLEVPVRVRHGDREKETVAIGIPPGSRLRRLPGLEGTPIRPLPGAVLFSDQLADRLKIPERGLLHLDYTRNRRELHAEAELRVGPVIRQPIGYPVYMHLADLQKKFAAPLGMPPDAVTGALLTVDPRYTEDVQRRLERMSGVAMVQSKKELEEQILELTAFSKTFIGLMFLFAAAMAFAGTYTATDSVLWERTRELATLRTLGFGMGRIALLVTVENVAVAAFGALSGLLPGRLLAQLLMELSQTEGFSMRAITMPWTYVLAVTGSLALTVLAQVPGLRRIAKLDLAQSVRLRDE
jgi:putative ABC transport system permease protein